MTQRILQRGEIETLPSRAIPRVRLPDRAKVFAQRAARLRTLAPGNALVGYLQFLAVVAAAQQQALAAFHPRLPAAEEIERAAEFGMPPIPATTWPRDAQWLAMLRLLAGTIASGIAIPERVVSICQRIIATPDEQIETQATALLSVQNDEVDVATAPIVMAALQVHWVALGAAFANADQVRALDVPGVCPLCGSLPVASIVCANTPYQGYRYLHCALCAAEWHMVRAQCSVCGADGRRVAYQTLLAHDTVEDAAAVKNVAVRAETCDECHGYRKVVYQESDIAVDPVADDVATLALDVLLAEKAFHRASGNPMLWQAAQD